MIQKEKAQICILVAEDDADDRLLLQDAWKNSNSQTELQFVENGLELMNYLQRRNEYSDEKLFPTPQIILLDLNMPKKDGYQALKEIKNDPSLKVLPVIIFTTSRSEDDILTSYRYGANSYISKPANFSELIQLVQNLKSYWEQSVLLPA